MIFERPNRALSALVALVFLVQTGCSGYKSLSRKDLDNPEEAQSYVVTTVDGVDYTFVSLHMEGETLMGTERITSTSTIGEGPEARETISNRYEERSIPWAEVKDVRAQVSRSQGGAWLAAASIAAGAIAFFLLATQDTEDDPPPDNGKEIP